MMMSLPLLKGSCKEQNAVNTIFVKVDWTYSVCGHALSLNHLDVGLFDDFSRVSGEDNVSVVKCLDTPLHPTQGFTHVNV